MAAPWRELKDAEITILAKCRPAEAGLESDWQRLHELFEKCRLADDAENAVCFHGVAALLAEQNGELELALKHRIIEIDKIVWLQEEERRNPTDGFQTQNYETADLEFRHEIVRELQATMCNTPDNKSVNGRARQSVLKSSSSPRPPLPQSLN